MRNIAFSLLCLIAIAVMSATPLLQNQFSTTHLPNDPVAKGVNTEIAWRKNERSENDTRTIDDPDTPRWVTSIRFDICTQGQIDARECYRRASRDLDHIRLARAPPLK